MPIYQFKLEGPIVPYTRTVRGQRNYDDRAARYHQSKENVHDQIATYMLINKWSQIPPQTPFWISLHREVPNRLNTWDLDNLIKAVNDAAEGAIIKDDRWLAYIAYAMKELGEEDVAYYQVGTMDEESRPLFDFEAKFDAEFPWRAQARINAERFGNHEDSKNG